MSQPPVRPSSTLPSDSEDDPLEAELIAEIRSQTAKFRTEGAPFLLPRDLGNALGD
jgi:hypothetical protein